LHWRRAEGKVMTNIFPVLKLACKREVPGKEVCQDKDG